MGNSSSSDAEFTRKSSSEDVVAKYGDRAIGKHVVVTGFFLCLFPYPVFLFIFLKSFSGGNGGLGFETARVLALKGAIVTIGCRSEKNGTEAVAKILKDIPDAKISFLLLDLGSFSSIRKFASDYKASGKPLNILINNAGVMACPKTLTSEGLEMQFGTNHIGHFLLTNELLDLIKSSGTTAEPARIINLSSIGQYYFSPPMGIRLDDLKAEQSYDQWERYGSSKLANILFTKQLHRLMSEASAPVISVSVHPGVINETNLGRHLDLANALNISGKLLFKGPGAMYEFFSGDTKNIKQGICV